MKKISFLIKENKGKIVILSFLLIVLFFQTLNFTGFCYDEARYLSERELIDRLLFKQEAANLNYQQKVEKIKERGGEYPNCCRITGEPVDLSPIDRELNKIFGRFFYEVQISLLNNNPSEKRYPNETSYVSLNACGTQAISGPVDRGTKEQYEFNLQQTAKHLKE